MIDRPAAWDGKLTRVQLERLLAPYGVLRCLYPSESKPFFLLVDGFSAKQAAGELGIKAASAYSMRGRILSKLELGSLEELKRFAVAHGLLDEVHSER